MTAPVGKAPTKEKKFDPKPEAKFDPWSKE